MYVKMPFPMLFKVSNSQLGFFEMEGNLLAILSISFKKQVIVLEYDNVYRGKRSFTYFTFNQGKKGLFHQSYNLSVSVYRLSNEPH